MVVTLRKRLICASEPLICSWSDDLARGCAWLSDGQLFSGIGIDIEGRPLETGHLISDQPKVA
jgi:hypothetical protein